MLLGVLLAAACAQPAPVEHVQLYADAAAQTKTAGNLLLDRISPIIASQDTAQSAARLRTGRPSRVSRDASTCAITGNGAGRSDPPSIATQRTALDLVAAYARILADLAEGKSTANLQAKIGTAATTAGVLATLPGVGAPMGASVPLLVPQVQALAGRLEAQRAGQVVRQSLIADRETIQAVLKALEETRPPCTRSTRPSVSSTGWPRSLRATGRQPMPLSTNQAVHAALEAYVQLLRRPRQRSKPSRASPAGATADLQAVKCALKQAIEPAPRRRRSEHGSSARQPPALPIPPPPGALTSAKSTPPRPPSSRPSRERAVRASGGLKAPRPTREAATGY